MQPHATKTVNEIACSPPRAPGRIVEGSVLSGFQVVRWLGAGAMGEVYEARELSSGERRALKLLSLAARASDVAVERFLREARVLGGIKHPNLMEIYGVARFPRAPGATMLSGEPFLVMELLEGRDLGREGAGGRLEVGESVELVAQALRGVAALHACGVVHRDLKPDNLFVTTDRQVKVIDVGIARSGSKLTLATTLLGSPSYMAPERWHGAASERSDIWSMGVILYELLAGCLPFRIDGGGSTGERLALLFEQVSSREAPPLHLRRRDVHPGLEAVIARCLRKRPEERYASAAAMADALEAFTRPRACAPALRSAPAGS